MFILLSLPVSLYQSHSAERRSTNNENNRHHQATQTPHPRVAVEATRSDESAPVLRTSASATSGSTRRRSRTIASSSTTGAPVQPTTVSGGSLARREAIEQAFRETQPSDNTAQRGSATPHATSPTTPRRSAPAHQTPTTPSHRTATQPTSPTNPRLSRAEIIANAIRASRAEQTTPPPGGQGQGVAHRNSSNQSPSAPFGVVSWPAHPDMSFSLAVNNRNGGGGVMAPTSVRIVNTNDQIITLIFTLISWIGSSHSNVKPCQSLVLVTKPDQTAQA